LDPSHTRVELQAGAKAEAMQLVRSPSWWSATLQGLIDGRSIFVARLAAGATTAVEVEASHSRPNSRSTKAKATPLRFREHAVQQLKLVVEVPPYPP